MRFVAEHLHNFVNTGLLLSAEVNAFIALSSEVLAQMIFGLFRGLRLLRMSQGDYCRFVQFAPERIALTLTPASTNGYEARLVLYRLGVHWRLGPELELTRARRAEKR
ncbi:unnamed protein product [Durusdinium trenchii]|uniref:Uncharacterized protein n=1 Tax=Durusdinium trenchii TaxID=1381693 RepID=A0ABP0ISE3_9DINO